MNASWGTIASVSHARIISVPLVLNEESLILARNVMALSAATLAADLFCTVAVMIVAERSVSLVLHSKGEHVVLNRSVRLASYSTSMRAPVT